MKYSIILEDKELGIRIEDVICDNINTLNTELNELKEAISDKVSQVDISDLSYTN